MIKEERMRANLWNALNVRSKIRKKMGKSIGEERSIKPGEIRGIS